MGGQTAQSSNKKDLSTILQDYTFSQSKGNHYETESLITFLETHVKYKTLPLYKNLLVGLKRSKIQSGSQIIAHLAVFAKGSQTVAGKTNSNEHVNICNALVDAGIEAHLKTLQAASPPQQNLPSYSPVRAETPSTTVSTSASSSNRTPPQNAKLPTFFDAPAGNSQPLPTPSVTPQNSSSGHSGNAGQCAISEKDLHESFKRDWSTLSHILKEFAEILQETPKAGGPFSYILPIPVWTFVKALDKYVTSPSYSTHSELYAAALNIPFAECEPNLSRGDSVFINFDGPLADFEYEIKSTTLAQVKQYVENIVQQRYIPANEIEACLTQESLLRSPLLTNNSSITLYTAETLLEKISENLHTSHWGNDSVIKQSCKLCILAYTYQEDTAKANKITQILDYYSKREANKDSYYYAWGGLFGGYSREEKLKATVTLLKTVISNSSDTLPPAAAQGVLKNVARS